MIKQNDPEYRDAQVMSVHSESDGDWSITTDDGWSFFVRKEWGIRPVPGMTARFYGKGIGYSVRGLDLDARECFYRTPQQEAEEHRRQRAELDAQRRREFDQNCAQMDLEYDLLPPNFRRRIDRFRTGNPEFRWQFEPYEMSCCRDAVLIASALQEQACQRAADNGVVETDPVKTFEEFRALSWAEQKALIPTLFEGHSGNSFGMACRLAYLHVVAPELVEKEHGALTPLVGCKEYGCTHQP